MEFVLDVLGRLLEIVSISVMGIEGYKTYNVNARSQNYTSYDLKMLAGVVTIQSLFAFSSCGDSRDYSISSR